MEQSHLTSFRNWFATYSGSFRMPDPADQLNITLKQDHTAEVCRNMLRIAGELGLDGPDLLLAETIALFHDVGRFSQYRQYRTFDDSRSVNHAAFGAKVLIENRVLEDLDAAERDVIVHAVTLHNVFCLPSGLDDRTRLFARLIRDADKLDITRVVIDFFSRDPADRADAVSLGLAEDPAYTPSVLASLSRGEMAKKKDLRTTTDFKLLQLAWFFDLNFPASLRMVMERGYVDLLERLLPDDDAIRTVIAGVRSALARKLEGA